jgi:hypothetical protein
LIYFFWGVTVFSMTVGGAAISLIAFAVARPPCGGSFRIKKPRACF